MSIIFMRVDDSDYAQRWSHYCLFHLLLTALGKVASTCQLNELIPTEQLMIKVFPEPQDNSHWKSNWTGQQNAEMTLS